MENWTENLGEGVLCRVWNDETTNPDKVIKIIREISPDTGMFNDGWSCVFWKYAEPIKLEEIEKYILKG